MTLDLRFETEMCLLPLRDSSSNQRGNWGSTLLTHVGALFSAEWRRPDNIRSTQQAEATVRQSQERLEVGPLAGEGELRLEGVMSVAGQDQAKWGFALAVTSQEHGLELFSSPGNSMTECFG